MNKSGYSRKAEVLLAQEARVREKIKELYAAADKAKADGKIILAIRNKQRAEQFEEDARGLRVGADRALAKASQDSI